MICDTCDYHVAHSYCCGFGNSIPNEDWNCDYCQGILSEDDSDFDDDGSDLDEISEGELEILSFTNPAGRVGGGLRHLPANGILNRIFG